VLVFGGDRFASALALLLYSCAQSVPRKTRAFDASGEFAYAVEIGVQ
jgi:hypothetical protein